MTPSARATCSDPEVVTASAAGYGPVEPGGPFGTPSQLSGRRVVVGRSSYCLTELSRRGDWRVVLVEWPGRPAMPDFHARRRLHLREASGNQRVMTLFTDAAGTRTVRAWSRELPLGPTVYTEEHRSTDGADLLEGVLPPEAEPRRWPLPDVGTLHGAEAARLGLLARLHALPSIARHLHRRRRLDAAEQLRELVEGSRSPELPRRIWRELIRFRVLDPQCESGAWLVGCLEALGAVGAACLQRMQGWLEEDRGRPPGRGRFADFALLLRRERELRRNGHRDRFVLETVMLNCLRGIAADREGAVSARRALAARLRDPGRSIAGVDLALPDIRVGRLRVREAELRGSRSEASGRIGGALDAEVDGEAEVLARAEQHMVRLRLLLGADAADLAEGRAEIRKRREALSARAGLRMAGAEGRPTALDPGIEYSGILRSGGFALVRAPAAGDTGEDTDVASG
jgi:hypothetical protein